jgi:DNA mismatch repair protein MutL
MDAYEQLIPAGEQISYFIYFEVDPANIDVNIHPTKTEIKFENEQAIWQILSAAVKESLGKFNAVPSIDFDTEGMPDIPAFEQSRPIEPPKVHYNADFNPFKTSSASSYSSGGSYPRQSVEWEGLYSGLEKASRMNEPVEEEPLAFEEAVSAVTEAVEPASQSSSLYSGDSSSMEKGAQHLQFKGRFILTSVKSGLMLIDQHRAHVRVLFDRYMTQIRQRQGVSQGVLFPELIQLPVSEAAVLESLSDDLAAVGFDLSPLGGGSYAINGIPSGIEGLNPVELVRNMVHTAMEKGSDVKEEVRTILALTLARAAAIVYGQVLSNDEMSNLVDSLFACSTPSYTPDGRTVLSTIREEDIEKLFQK